ncbi:MAG TPA: phosphatidylserine decarboxylase [Bacteroidales bacterium]|mgnify:CR=1 FL=1|nr:phosphatidylserine decarboxylase [Bacteroidales bacterium]
MTIKELIVNTTKLAQKKFRLHPEGKSIIANMLSWLLIANGILFFLSISNTILTIIYILSIAAFLSLIYYFRNPERKVIPDEKYIYAPVDGRITSVTEVVEPEYFKKKFVRVEISLSLTDIHVLRVPLSGKVKYCHFQLEDYRIAWHQLLSHKESASVGLISDTGTEIFLKQTGGAIVSYANENNYINQGNDLGFIIWGSSVDLFIPLSADIRVKAGERVVGNITILAKATS